MTTDRADLTIKALRTGHDELASLVRDFTADDLTHATGASEWDVSQVLSHLGSGAEINLAVLESALNGTERPDGDFNRSVWARWDAMTPAERAERFLEADEVLVRRYEGLDAQARADLRIDLGFLPAPVDVATAATMRLSEFAHHAWDVRVGFDPTAALAPEATRLLLDQTAALIGFLAKPAALDGRQVALAVRLTSPDRSFGLELGDAATVGDTPDRPDGVLTAPAEWWLRAVTGRHAPDHTPAAVVLTGDAITLDDLRRVFPGF
ncbi:maleylpyruvate isomerase family mycothiol-dependent enzyme [Streptomyces sp. NPDC059255]|uniref:maleylpyruvate isomerase family mycothiol-dependent enzyme n=1 Tax=Streptomyces sp. NPDC059255 TaxID=3346793 RepID=UPI0036CE6E05